MKRYSGRVESVPAWSPVEINMTSLKCLYECVLMCVPLIYARDLPVCTSWCSCDLHHLSILDPCHERAADCMTDRQSNRHTHTHTRTHTHTQKQKSLSLPITGHAFLDKPGHLCTKQVRCAGAMSTPGVRARNSQEVPTMPPTAGVGTL